ncbi:MAG: RNase adapter RapZ [Gammaproteobacteria bacterium]
MKLMIISGLSGSGKSIALHVLEDLDYYCIDNLPVGMLPALAEQVILAPTIQYEDYAVGIDARTIAQDLSNFPHILRDLRAQGIRCEVIFLEATTETLIKRFSETRRKHPLTDSDMPLKEAIFKERSLLEPVSASADLHIDTSQTTIHQLRDLLHERITEKSSRHLSLLFESFGFKHGIPVDADFVFDVRCLPNPHWVPELRAQTGKDPAVATYLESHTEVLDMFNDIVRFLERWIPCFEADNRSYMTIAIGCTGGQHRSVYFATRLLAHFKQLRDNTLVRHRELS